MINMDKQARIKIDLLSRYPRHGVFIETGTAQAFTATRASMDYEKVYTIELDFGFYLNAVKKFAHSTSIFPIYGDSAEVLPALLSVLDEPCVILLDAHYVGSGARGESDTPVREELEAIFPSGRQRHLPHVVLIDDARLFGADPAYPTIESIEKFAARVGFQTEIKDDIIRMTSRRNTLWQK